MGIDKIAFKFIKCIFLSNMGIKDLLTTIKGNTYLEQVHPSEIEGAVIAYDISGMIYKYKAISKNWSAMLRSIFKNIKKHDIIPIVVFDGKPPEDKAKTVQDRIDNKSRHDTNLAKIGEAYEEYLKSGLIDPILEFALVDEIVQPDLVSTKLKKKSTRIVKEDIHTVQHICMELDIEYMFAKNEAETLCCKLVYDGIADFVASNDSDNLAYPINGYIDLNKTKSDNIVFHNKSMLLDCMELSEEQFLDYCILLGTDYNKRIHMIGPVNALKMIRTYGRIENFPPSIDTSSLKYPVVRKLFDLSMSLEEYKDECSEYTVLVTRPIPTLTLEDMWNSYE